MPVSGIAYKMLNIQKYTLNIQNYDFRFQQDFSKAVQDFKGVAYPWKITPNMLSHPQGKPRMARG